MPTLQELKATYKQDRENTTRESIWDQLPDIDARVREVLKKDAPPTAEATPDTAEAPIIPKIKELEILKEGVYAVDLEKTVNDMFTIIKSMESQLDHVLSINVHLEKDLASAKEIISDLTRDKETLHETILRMETEIPFKRELQMEIDHLTEDRNEAQTHISTMKAHIAKLQGTIDTYQRRSGDLEEEKLDVITEINFLESRLNAAAVRIKDYETQVNILKGEKLAHLERIQTLEKDWAESQDEKFKILGDLKKTQDAMQELHAAVADTKLKAKKSFYKGARSTPDSAAGPDTGPAS